jgi:hypothetical protein
VGRCFLIEDYAEKLNKAAEKEIAAKRFGDGFI